MKETSKSRRALLHVLGVILFTALLCVVGWLLMRASVRQMFQPIEEEEPRGLAETAEPDDSP